MKIALLFLLIGTILSLSSTGAGTIHWPTWISAIHWPTWAKWPAKIGLGKTAG